ncbi:diguanylate cyclase [Paenibacillus sp. YYML68]|uniref:diguanylate cyclase n=1 Tax=Paenibacillus sp. YYML68 TaxID=2909250 RepID=UPI002492F722|nr:diguanylate cyclase [Paenibacillus sp. YYML68]
MDTVRNPTGEDRSGKEQRLLKEGRKRYVRELEKQLGQLNAWIGAPDDEEYAVDTAKQIYRVVHTLKGSAPMFGFIRIGSGAQKLVDLWEWTQHDDAVINGAFIMDRFIRTSSLSEPILRELELELDIYSRELELDEHHERYGSGMMMSGGERMLVIDDDDVLRSYLVRRLRMDGYEVDEAADVAEAQRLLRQKPYQLITLDLMMHPVSGYELFEFLKDDPTLKWTPLIVLSGRNDVNDKVRCFYLGADDYVTKPFQYEELSARIYSLLKRTRTFEQMAFRDPLTGAYNRRFFDHQINVELQRITRYPAPISLVFIDIDRFKSINDTHGHHIGDLVLQGLAHLLQGNIRSTDLLARFGGEEFVVVLPNTTGADAQRIMESILRQAHLEPVAQNEGHMFYITFSAGVAEWRPGISVQEWTALADEAMYEAKQSGRNRIVLSASCLSSPLPSNATASGKRSKVLIADDDKILRSILLAKLKHLPVDFYEAEDGEEAYKLIRHSAFDLCILDGVMPNLDGFGVLERMKEHNTRPPELKVLILSGRSREEDVSRGLELGANSYMHKPFSMVELELKVKEMLQIYT